MGSLSIWHWLIVAIVAGLLFFGWKQLPDMARSLGRSMRVFKTEIKGMNDDDKVRDSAREEAKQATETPAIEPRRAELVKNDTTPPPPAQRPSPRPSPRPNATSTTRTPGAS